MSESHVFFIPQRRRLSMPRERNHLLDSANTSSEVDDALIELGCVSAEEKCDRLISYMGAQAVRTMANDVDYEEFYAVTVEVFLRGNWRDLSE